MFKKLLNSWREYRQFRKSLTTMSAADAWQARGDRWFHSLRPEVQEAYNKVWGIRHGDVLMGSFENGKEVRMVTVTTGTSGGLVIDLNDRPRNRNDLIFYSGNDDSITELARSMERVIHRDDPEWVAYVQWIWGGPKPPSADAA